MNLPAVPCIDRGEDHNLESETEANWKPVMNEMIKT